MWDESGENEEVVCPLCGANADDGCEHVLILVDATFSECMGGKADDIMPQIIEKITESFRGYLIAGKHPNWSHWEVEQLWDNIQIDGVDDPADLSVEYPSMYDIVLGVLDEAGGYDHPGKLVSGSGPYSESSVRLMYAKNPSEVCEKALPILDRWLIEEQAPRRKRRKKKDDS